MQIPDVGLHARDKRDGGKLSCQTYLKSFIRFGTMNPLTVPLVDKFPG